MMASAISEVGYQVYELAEEMREAFEDTPEVFQSTTGKPREEAADDLERANDILMGFDLPEHLRDEEIVWMEMRAGKTRRLFRRVRRDNVVRCLRACVARLSAVSQDDDITERRKELQRVIDLLDAVFFPGMTGRRAA